MMVSLSEPARSVTAALRVHPRLGHVQGDARREPRQQRVVLAPAFVLAELFRRKRERKNDTAFRVQEEEPLGQDADDVEDLTVESKLASDDAVYSLGESVGRQGGRTSPTARPAARYQATIARSNRPAKSSGLAGRGESFVTRCCGTVPSTSAGMSAVV
jgi:hypothetical protein